MSRHSKNNTAHSIFTYWERKKLKDVGTLKERLGAESMRQFEQCWLCLRPAVEPVCTPKGCIFCRQCIILNFGDQKKAQEVQMRAWQASQAIKKKEEEAAARAGEEAEIRRFVETEHSASGGERSALSTGSRKRSHDTQDGRPASKIAVLEVLDKTESRRKNFWIPENTPTRSSTTLSEPKRHLSCPITGVPLKLKDLLKLNPVIVNEAANSAAANSGQTTRWICPFSRKVISHQKAVAVIPTGQVVQQVCAEKFLLGEKKGDSDEDGVYERSDLIPLITGGTGFSAHNKVEAEIYRPVME